MKDLTGQRFGRLTVLYMDEDKVTPSGYRVHMWRCICDCGTEKTVRGKSLTGGVTRSCGCLAKELVGIRASKHNGFGTRLYAIWNSMRQRCNNSNHRSYHNYGGRGISICSEWDDFAVFREWAYNSGYNEHGKRGEFTLDRIDVDGDYTPENCKWSTMKEQSNNKRTTIYLEKDGEIHTLKDWADITGIKYETLWKRYHNGKSTDEIFKKINK